MSALCTEAILGNMAKPSALSDVAGHERSRPVVAVTGHSNRLLKPEKPKIFAVNMNDVRFGQLARTLEYQDADGLILFTFDLSPADPKRITLEHNVSLPRGIRYDKAFEATRKYLEARGYVVNIFDH
jgi:hypothetical protein